MERCLIKKNLPTWSQWTIWKVNLVAMFLFIDLWFMFFLNVDQKSKMATTTDMGLCPDTQLKCYYFRHLCMARRFYWLVQLSCTEKLLKVTINYYWKINSGLYIRSILITFCLVLGIFHVYDGVVREHPDKKGKNVLIRLKDVFFEKFGIDEYKKVLVKDAEVAVLALHPTWQLLGKNSDGMNTEEMLNRVRYIISGLWKIYLQMF